MSIRSNLPPEVVAVLDEQDATAGKMAMVDCPRGWLPFPTMVDGDYGKAYWWTMNYGNDDPPVYGGSAELVGFVNWKCEQCGVIIGNLPTEFSDAYRGLCQSCRMSLVKGGAS